VGVGREPNAAGAVHEVDLVPFYTVHQRTYSTYWDLVTPAEWSAQQAGYVRDAERLRAIEAATVAFVHPGESASEQKFNLQTGGKDVTPVRVVGRAGRAGRSWFSYDLPAQSDQPLALLVTYYSADRRSSPASFQILVDGHVLADQHVERTDPGRFYDVRYDVPAGLVQGRDSLTIKFQADDKSQIAAIFGVRLIRAADAQLSRGRSTLSAYQVLRPLDFPLIFLLRAQHLDDVEVRRTPAGHEGGHERDDGEHRWHERECDMVRGRHFE
jgi:hypothetical protein